MDVHLYKMGLPELKTSSQPSAARQSSCGWSYGQRGRAEDSGAEVASRFASVVLPLFWKSQLDSVRISSSAGNPSPRTDHFQHRSVITDDVAVLGSLDSNGTSSYHGDGNRNRYRREGGLGVLTAVRSEGDLRCKYSAALSSARCFNAEPQDHKQRSQAESDFATVNASFYWDAGVQQIPGRPGGFRITPRGSHHSARCTEDRRSLPVFRSAHYQKEAHQTHPPDTGTAKNVESRLHNARTHTAVRAPASPRSFARSAHSRLPAEPLRKKLSGPSALRQAFQDETDIFQPETLPQETRQTKSQRPSAVRQDRENMTELSGKELEEELKRAEIEKSHGRMREHMADMLRFLDRMQGKHARRHATAAFRLRAAKVSDGPTPIPYAALRCLSGIAGGLVRGRESQRATPATHDARTPRAAPLRRSGTGAAAGREEDDAGRSVRRHAAAAGGVEEEPRKQRKRDASATKKVENQSSTERDDVASVAQTTTSDVTAEGVNAEAELRSGEVGGERGGPYSAEKERLHAAASVALASSEEIALDGQVIAGTGNMQRTVAAADDAEHSMATGIIISRQEGTSTQRSNEECTEADRRVPRTETVGRALEVGASERVKVSTKPKRTPPTDKRSKKSASIGGPGCAAARKREKTATPSVLGCERRQHTRAAGEFGDKWIDTDDEVMALRRSEPETGNSANGLGNATIVNSAVTQESEGHAEEGHKNLGITVHDRGGQEMKCGVTTENHIEHQKPCSTKADQQRAPPGDVVLCGLSGMVVGDKQVEPILDAAAVSFRVASPSLESGNCEGAPREYAERKQRLQAARQEGVQAAAEVHVTEEETGWREPDVLTDILEEADDDYARTEEGLGNVLPTDVPQRELARAGCQLSQVKKASAGTVEGESQCKQQVENMLKDGAEEFLAAGAAFQQYRRGTLQDRTGEGIVQTTQAAVEPNEDVFHGEVVVVQLEPTGRVGPETTVGTSEAAFQVEQEIILEKDADETILEKGKFSRNGEGTQLEHRERHSLATNRKCI